MGWVLRESFPHSSNAHCDYCLLAGGVQSDVPKGCSKCCKNCRLVSGAKCADGLCCDVKKCQVILLLIYYYSLLCQTAAHTLSYTMNSTLGRNMN